MMSDHMTRLKRSLLLLAFAGAFTACSSSPNPSFYLLSDSGGAAALMDDGAELVIAVGPVTLRDYMNRKQIVGRPGRNEVSLDEFARWAEPLEKSVTVVLAENLSALIGTDHVIDYYANLSVLSDYRVRVRVTAFERAPDGDVRLSALWTVADRAQKVVALERSSYRESVAGDSPRAVVAAMSEALGRMSRDIAEAIRKDLKDPLAD